jgi:hypothetical protein
MQSKLPRQRVSHHPAEVHACPTVHSAPCTTRYRCLPTGVTGSRSRPHRRALARLFYVGLTHNENRNRFNRTLTQRPQRRCPRGASVVTSRTENNHGN